MKVIILLIVFFCFVISSSATEMKIEQHIATDIDKGGSAFLLGYTVNGDSPILTRKLLRRGNYITFFSQTDYKEVVFEAFSGYYELDPGFYFYYVDFSRHVYNTIIQEMLKKDNIINVVWELDGFDSEDMSIIGRFRTDIFLASEIDAKKTINNKKTLTMNDILNQNIDKTKNDLVFRIVQLVDDNPFSFALLAINHTDKEIDLSGRNTLSIRFPNGKKCSSLYPAIERKMILSPRENKIVKIDVKKLIESKDDFSLSDFEYGLSEMVWSIKMPDETTLSLSHWFVKFNGLIPQDSLSNDYYGAGYKLDGPFELETFRSHGIVPSTHGFVTSKDIKNRLNKTKRPTEEYLEATDKMMVYNIQQKTRTICDFSQLEKGTLLFKDIPFDQVPNIKYLEIDVKDDSKNKEMSRLVNVNSAEYLIRLHSDNPGDGFIVEENELKEAPNRDYLCKEISLAINSEDLVYSMFPFFIAFIKIGNRYGKIVMNAPPGADATAEKETAGNPSILSYRYNLDFFFNKKLGDRNLTKYLLDSGADGMELQKSSSQK